MWSQYLAMALLIVYLMSRDAEVFSGTSPSSPAFPSLMILQRNPPLGIMTSAGEGHLEWTIAEETPQKI